MTDEEMAEASWRSRDLTYKVSADNKSYIDGFLTGLKTGRPKWSRVDNGDLPPEDTKVLVLIESKGVLISHFYKKNVSEKIGNIIAYCDIPE